MTDTSNPKTTFFATRNFVSADALRMPDPWTYDASNAPWELPKPKWKSTWLNNGSSDHRLVSACEGAVPGVRTGTDNPVCAIHGFIADYDGAIPTDIGEILKKKAPCGELPAYAVETQSGKLRLVWIFETPLRVAGTDHAKRMLTAIALKLKADKWFSGYDDKGSEDPFNYQCIGKKWYPAYPDYRLSAALVMSWDAEVFRRMQEAVRVRAKTADIPFEDIRKEAQTRGWAFPADFEEGLHCRRFWDADSDNDNGCLIYKTGIRVYVPHDKPFMGWADIFGRSFTDKYNSAKYSALAGELWYERNTGDYWAGCPDGSYMKRNAISLTRQLKVAGLSSVTPKDATYSQIDEALLQIEAERAIDGVADFVYHAPGVLRRPDGKLVLNTSRIKVVPPSAPLADPLAPWGDKTVSEAFPFIHGLLTHMFGAEVPMAQEGDPKQIERFLWWLSHFYKTGYYRRPQNGQALFIAGGAGQGKTFLACQLIPPLMGGVSTNASEHLMGETRWTDGIAGQPVLNVDDDSSAVTPIIHEKFALKVKRYIANGELPWAKRFCTEVSVPWFGRIIITLNTDRRSLSIIPDLGNSNGDKVTLLLASDGEKYRGFGTYEYNQEMLRREMPAFARYLLDLEIPEEYRDKRYGVKEFHHPSLLSVSKTSDSMSTLVEAFDIAFKGLNAESGKTLNATEGRTPGHWTGTASELHTYLSNAYPAFCRDYVNARTLGRELSRMQDKGWSVECVPSGSMVKRWRISYEVAQRGEDKEKAEKARKEWAV
jgi:hypothetical protein